MLLSFFSPTSFVTGIDYSSNPDCIHTEDIDYDESTHSPSLTLGEDGKYSVELIEKPKPPVTPESPESKHARIVSKILSNETLKKEDLEWESFSSNEKGEIINRKIYGSVLEELVWQKKEIRLASKSKTLYTTPSTTIFSEKEISDCLTIQAQLVQIEELKTLLS